MDVFSDKFTIVAPKEGRILQISFAVIFFYNMSEDRVRQAAILDILGGQPSRSSARQTPCCAW